MDATFGSPGGDGGVRRGEWGPGKPSFWCMPDGSASGGHIRFLVQQENAGRIREEHPWCAGTAMSSIGGGIAKPTAAAELAHFQPPPGVTVQVRKSGHHQRFEDERGELSPAGHERLLRGFATGLDGGDCRGLTLSTASCGEFSIIFADFPGPFPVCIDTISHGAGAAQGSRVYNTYGSRCS